MSRGFTLVEMLVALSLFALIAIAGVTLIDATRRGTVVAAASLAATSELEQLRVRLAADLGQALPRVTLSDTGAPRPALMAGEGGMLLALNRPGAHGPETIEYRAASGRLWRRDGSGRDLAVLRGVLRAGIRTRHGGSWEPGWHDPRPRALPDAVEVTVETRRFGMVRQLFLVGGAG